MRKYLKAEIYHIAHGTFYRNLLFIFLILSLSANLLLKFQGTPFITNPFATSLTMLVSGVLTASPFMLYSMVNLVIGYDLKHKTLHNAIAGGVNRLAIVITKIAIATLISLLFAVLIISFHLLTAVVLMGSTQEVLWLMNSFLHGFVSAIPLWCGLIALYLLAALAMPNQVIAVILTFAFLFILPDILLLLGRLAPLFTTLQKYQPMTVLNRLIASVSGNQLRALDGRTMVYGGSLLLAATSGAWLALRRKAF